jgi:hypothetical protein
MGLAARRGENHSAISQLPITPAPESFDQVMAANAESTL